MKEGGVQPDDCFLADKGPGVFVWEGNIVGITYPSTPDSATEYDVEYRGTLRDLTDVEWACVRAGKNPLKDEGAGEGSVGCECGDDCPDSREPTLEEQVHDQELRLNSLWSSHGQLEAKVGQLEAAQELASKGLTLKNLWDKGE